MKDVVFVGVGIFPHGVAGDKNLLLDLSAYLKSEGIPTSFVTMVNVDGLPRAEGYRYVNRVLHKRSDRYIRRDENGRIIGYWHSHGRARTLLELTSTLFAEGRTIRAALLGPFAESRAYMIRRRSH